MKNVTLKKSKMLKVCPVCYSKDIHLSKGYGTGWLTPSNYYCEKCGYSGNLYLETDNESLNILIEEKEKENQKINTE